ncbi:MAG: TRAP transporter small permease [Proteobacteria bacterium]|nr:TRAP transporter small permease [Pseudomonadota bacterium]
MKTLLPPGPASRVLGTIADASVIACGWWLIALSAITCVEMLGRKLFGFSLQGVDEIGSYTYGIVGAFGFSYTLITRSHTRVDFLLSRFSPRLQAVLNLTAMLSLTALAVLCLWRGLNVVLESVDMKSTAATPLATPMWIPQTIWLVGYALFAAVALLAAWHALKLFVTGRQAQLNDQFGPQTLDEEIEAETEVRMPSQEATGTTATAMEGARA